MPHIQGTTHKQESSNIRQNQQLQGPFCRQPFSKHDRFNPFVKGFISQTEAFNTNKIHYICGDIDSMTWAISGNLNAEDGQRQKFKYVIKDQKFYDENYPLFFGQYKQLL
ncbi:MAG: hypothetical protein EZS28_016322 [Streblomastix strix]|uniref:Uncharacterized protein n=1 Tax=Streblomastix strix TaxID=222440 RepID=A0A5J4W0W7_9EUKA|nr:MAG: hypothetical protein EZS28_016322 [Streblomastix strix]